MTNTTPISLSHEAAARDLIQQIQALVAERLPDLSIIPLSERRRVAVVARVPDDFLETIAVTIDESPETAVPLRLTALEVRDLIVFSRIYQAFADQLEELVRNVRATVLARRYDVAQRALGVYGIAKTVNRPNAKLLVPNLASMRRTLGRSGTRKKPPESEVPATKQ